MVILSPTEVQLIVVPCGHFEVMKGGKACFPLFLLARADAGIQGFDTNIKAQVEFLRDLQ